MGQRELEGRVGRAKGENKDGGERKKEGTLGKWRLRVPPSQTHSPEPYLRPEGNGVKDRQASYCFFPGYLPSGFPPTSPGAPSQPLSPAPCLLLLLNVRVLLAPLDTLHSPPRGPSSHTKDSKTYLQDQLARDSRLLDPTVNGHLCLFV